MGIHSNRVLSVAIFALAFVPTTFAWPFDAATRPPDEPALERAGYVYFGGDYDVTVVSGRPTLIFRLVTSCGLDAARPAVGALANHGVVTTKDGVAPACGILKQPVTELWYVSSPGYRGSDTVTVLPYRTTLNVTVR
jgi:hypothetical protein